MGWFCSVTGPAYVPGCQKVSDIVVPATVQVERMGTVRAPIGSFAPSAEAAQAYRELWALVEKLVKPQARKRRR
jgi:chromosome partitioning protein